MEEEIVYNFNEPNEQDEGGNMVELNDQMANEEMEIEPTEVDLQREWVRRQREQHCESLERFFVEV